MSEFLTKTFYNNSVLEWLIALLIIVAAMLVGKFLYWLFSTVIKRMTQKSKTRLDDIIVDMIEEPLVFAVTCWGIWFGLRILNFPANVDTLVNNAFQFIIVICLGWMTARLLDSVIKEYVVPLVDASESDLDDQLLPILRKGVKTTVWAMAIIIGLDNAGYDVGAILAGLGIGGIALAMAAKDTVANVFGGFTIFTDQPFRINERVKAAGFDGTVKEIGIRSTRIQTLDGTIVTIPNSKFTSSAVENVSREPSRKIVLNLGLVYDTTPEQMEEAMKLLEEIVDQNEGTEEKRAVLFNAFGDFAMNICVVYYIRKEADIAGTQTQINLAILRAFNENNLEFAFPTQTLYNIDVKENV